LERITAGIVYWRVCGLALAINMQHVGVAEKRHGANQQAGREMFSASHFAFVTLQ
jgi:hypothetical protein